MDERIIGKACGEMYAKFNLLMRQFGMCAPNVLYRLFNSYFMSHYGSQLWNFSNNSVMETI